MKKLAPIILALLFLCQAELSSQSCLPEGITFSTQAQIDDFQINYPGCTQIEGFVFIAGNENITNLNELNVIESIDGDLTFRNANALPNLMGLNNLTSIGGNLLIRDNDSLVSLSGLESLISIQGDLEIGVDDWPSLGSNPLLISLSGLSNLNSIGGGFGIVANYSLTNFDGLTNLKNIGGSLEIQYNSSLIDFSGMDSLSFIGNSLMVYDNYSLVDFSGLKSLTSINGNVIIGGCELWKFSPWGNPSLTSLSGLDSVSSIAGNLHICANNDLINLSGLDNLTSIGGDLEIHLNDALASLTGLETLTSIGGSIRIGYFQEYYGAPCGNNSLTILSGLEGVTSIAGSLRVEENQALTSLSGLENIDAGSISYLRLTNNPSLGTCEVYSVCDYLSSHTAMISFNASGCNSEEEIEARCEGFQSCLPDGITFSTQAQIDSFQINYPGCTEIEGVVHIEGSDITDLSGLNSIMSIGDHLIIKGNDSLASLSGLENLKHIDGFLVIGSNDVPGGGPNPMLTDLTGLENLEQIGGGLSVCRNNALINFTGLENLSSMGDRFYCAQNASLLNFIGLEGLDSIGTDLMVGGNPSLQDFTGLEGLSRINGSLQLGDCYVGLGLVLGGNGQASFVGLHNIEYVGGDLDICKTERTHISGLEKLSYVGGTVSIHLNYNLESLSGLDSIKYIGNGIEIGWYNDYNGSFCGNPELTSIEALKGITSVGGGAISIERNPKLPSLSGLDNIDPSSIGSIYIWDQNTYSLHGHLTDCSVKSICEYLKLPGANAVFGLNASFDQGCNSMEEVEQNCENFGIQDQESILAVNIFPNPASGKVTISVPEGVELYSVRIYSHLGIDKRRIDKHEEYVDISDLPQGLYIMEIITDSGRERRKLIVY